MRFAATADGASVGRPRFGDLYLVRSKGVIGKLIRFWTRSRFSHGGIVLNKDLGIEANWRGVQVVRLPGEATILTPAEPLTKSDTDALREFLIGHLDAEYDYAGVLGFAFFKRWQNPKRWYCFELQFRAYEAMGRPLTRLDNEYIDGRTIYGSLTLKLK